MQSERQKYYWNMASNITVCLRLDSPQPQTLHFIYMYIYKTKQQQVRMGEHVEIRYTRSSFCTQYTLETVRTIYLLFLFYLFIYPFVQKIDFIVYFFLWLDKIHRRSENNRSIHVHACIAHTLNGKQRKTANSAIFQYKTCLFGKLLFSCSL